MKRKNISLQLPAPRFGGAIDLQDYPGLHFVYPGLIAVTHFVGENNSSYKLLPKGVTAISPG